MTEQAAHLPVNDTLPKEAQISEEECLRCFKCEKAAKDLGTVRKKIAKDVSALTIVDGWQSTKAIAIEWAQIIAVLTLVFTTNHWLAYIIAFAVVSAKQHAFGVLMHDATHFRLYKSRFWNDFISDIFLAFPILTTTKRYRHHHLLHHRHVNTEQDPYWEPYETESGWSWPKTPREAFKTFIIDMIGMGAVRNAKMLWHWSAVSNHFTTDKEAVPPPLSKDERIRYYIFTVGIVAAAIATGTVLELVFLWVVPVFTMMWMEIKMRTVAEHRGIAGDIDELNTTRHVDGKAWERYFFAPYNINYHLAHHLFPGVPFYNLPKLHELLMEHEEYFCHAHHKESYLSLDPEKGVLGEILDMKKKETQSAT